MRDSSGIPPTAGRGYGRILSTPSPQAIDRARITDYARWLADCERVRTQGSYAQLWRWSVSHPDEFWSSLWEYFDVIGDPGQGPAIEGERMPDITWFPQSTLNYSRNALRAAESDPGRTAVIFRSEAGQSGSLGYGELDRQVAIVRAALISFGVEHGDRVAAYLPNSPHALIGLLATASLGAIWTSCSPDFGASAVVDRFAQVSPKMLIAVDGYVYGGRTFDRRSEVAAIAAELPGLQAIITVSYIGAVGGYVGLPVPATDWDALAGLAVQADGAPAYRTEFDEVPFSHPRALPDRVHEGGRPPSRRP